MNIYIFKFSQYRKAFTELFQVHRQQRPGWSTAILAERIRVQPRHTTNVIKERSHFSSDQIFAIGAELGLSDEETEYLDQLMEWERAEHPERKQRLLSSIQKVRDQKLRVEKELKAKPNTLSPQQSEYYYLDPNVELMHLYLGTKDAPTDVLDLAQLWGFSPEYVSDIILFLQKTHLVRLEKNRWVVNPTHQLLTTGSPLCKPQQMLKRMRALESLQKLSADRVYSFSATLTMNEETKLWIQGRFVEFLKEVEQAVLASPSETLYHFQFDLFPWLSTKKSKR